MSMVVAWLLFPVVLLAVCGGCGLLVERVGGFRLPGALVPSVGFGTLIVLGTALTYKSATTRPAMIVAPPSSSPCSSRKRARIRSNQASFSPMK